MKHLKALGLLVMAAASLTAFAGSALAANVLTSPEGTGYTGELDATLELETTAVLKAGIEDRCTESTAKGPVTTNDESHASGTLSALTFGSCTQHTKTITPGSLTINDAGEVFAIGNRVEVNVTGVATCYYGGGESPGTKLGTLTPGSPARLEANTSKLKRLEGSSTFWCATNGIWTANYVVTTPETLLVDNFPGPAVLTSPEGAGYTGEIHATLKSGSSAVLKAGIEDRCTESTAKGPVSTNDETHASGTLSALTFGSCTQHTKTITPGSLTINDAGEVFAIGNRVEVNVTGVATCYYGGGESPGTKLGTLTPGSPARLEVNTSNLKRLEGSSTFWCSKEGTWTASYVVTSPSSLFIT